jgi:hypothetical protein
MLNTPNQTIRPAQTPGNLRARLHPITKRRQKLSLRTGNRRRRRPSRNRHTASRNRSAARRRQGGTIAVSPQSRLNRTADETTPTTAARNTVNASQQLTINPKRTHHATHDTAHPTKA